MDEFDRALGGGIVPGSLSLLGGDPGIGKSTLLLQISRLLAVEGEKVLYVSGEESLRQIKMRATRIGEFAQDIYLLSETDFDKIERQVETLLPTVLVIDSIQTMHKGDVTGLPGSIVQVREVAAALMYIAKRMEISVFVIGHVTKDGTVAGPRMLEHLVDTVLYLEGESTLPFRFLRAVKNRFGATDEVGVFSMDASGLAQVENPSEMLLAQRFGDEPGCVVTGIMEGSRCLLAEVQALVCPTHFGNPRRTASGYDINRVNLLIAVIERRLGIPMSQTDVYVNVVGGLRVNEPAMDLAVVAAVLSSAKNKVIPKEFFIFGEVGLSGEVRAVASAQARVKEAVKNGLGVCLLGKTQESAGSGTKRVVAIRNIKELLPLVSG
jgi:DNA repair protein RadA/Sms